MLPLFPRGFIYLFKLFFIFPNTCTQIFIFDLRLRGLSVDIPWKWLYNKNNDVHPRASGKGIRFLEKRMDSLLISHIE